MEGIVLKARVGVYPEEKLKTQKLRLDVEVIPPQPLCPSSLSETIDYDALISAMQDMLLERHTELVETVANALADMILERFGALFCRIKAMKIEVIPGAAVGVAVERTRRGAFFDQGRKSLDNKDGIRGWENLWQE